MFRICLIGAFSVLLLVFNPRAAIAIDLYGFGSYWEIEDADGVWGGGVGLSLPLFTEYLRLDGRVYIFENSDFDDDNELDLLPIDVGAQVHFLPDQRFDPYILGGVSWIYVDSDRIDVDSDVGAYVGAGLDFELVSVIKPFAEVVYRIAELDSDDGFLDGRFRDEDIDVSGVTANAGIKIHF